MDESRTKYDLMIHSNEQVEKPSNQINSSSGIKLIDENHFNTDSKSSPLIRKQGLKEYLTTAHTPDKNINSTYKLHNFSSVNLINFVPKIDDYNKPVKVKSQWTRTSQMELALENSSNKNPLPVNNSSNSEKINEIFTMDVSPENSIINQINEPTNDTRKTNKKTDPILNYESHCCVVVHNCDDNSVQGKRKRGRPKKITCSITDDTSTISNIGKQDPVKTSSVADMEPKNTEEPKVIKRGRGRPRKNEITSTSIQISTIVSNSTPAKKRKITKQGMTVIKKQRTTKLKSDQLENEDINDSKLLKLGPGHPSKLSSSEAIKSLTKKLNKHFLGSDETEVNENSPESGERSFSPIMLFPGDGNDFKCITISRFDDTEKTPRITLARCDALIEQENTTPINFLEGCNKLNEQENTTHIHFSEGCDMLNEQETTTSFNFSEDNKSNGQENTTSNNFSEGCNKLNEQVNTTSINFLEESSKPNNIQDKIDCVSGTRDKTDKLLSESIQDIFSELEKVDWNPAPKRIRSNSVNESTKIKNRRNSLTDNFMYQPAKKSKNTMLEDLKLLKSWKSVSYLERGPNIQVERIIQDELIKKFRSKLKRSRSFPNCLFLDTVIWRFLVQECEDECESEEDDLDSDSDSDSDSDFDLCENSELMQQYEQPEEKTNYMSGRFDNLNMLCSTNDLKLFQIPPNIRELENSECDPEHHRDSDRCERCSLENSVPIQQYETPKEKTDYMFRSLDNLNTLCSTNDIPLFQIPPNISELKNSESDQEESEGKIRRSKRLNTKVKDTDMLEEEYLLSSENSKIDSLLLADEIRKENAMHLAEARANDPELDKKLKKLNFTLITNNLFRPHRKKMGEYTPAEAQELRKLKPRRTINSDTYKCHCKYTRKDWIEKKPGCATECLNRLLNIECGKACVLRSLCTNKQFQNKQFKRTKIVKTADKGYGVFALEDIPSGTFVDEYMGEVIDQNEMIKRMKKVLYKNNNYMVQLKHDEIIDATRKGNITRFINHSCEPNCVAEKWNVLGESRMGFFSKQLILKGEEITFDYSFEIFGDAAQQKCYCGTPKCRGFISKKSRTGDQSSSEDSDDHEDDTSIVKPDTCEEKKKKKKTEKISNKDRKRLKQLDQQLTDISKLKNKNRSDLESSTLNLNKLMVHITDSMSRSHILKFIRDNDLNCKRLFMNFNGLNIIHSWMTSNNNESLKLEIIKTLSDLPISNRNTIKKSKVLDIVAQWANIPLNIKEVIENLDYPVSKIEEHEQKIDKLLPNVNNLSSLVQTARILWKKWMSLKIVFKIPKLDRPKEVNIPDDVIQPPILFSQPETNLVPYHFGKPTVPNQLSKMSCVQSQGNGQTNSVDTLNKVTLHPNQKINRNKNNTVFEWNKKQWDYLPFKTNKAITPAMVNNSINSVLNPKQSITSTFKSRIIHQEIPTIESSTLNKNMKWSGTTENDSTVHELTDSTEKVNSTCTQGIKVFDTEPIVYYPIEEIITTNQTWNLPPPTILDLCNGSTLQSMLKTVPPCLPNDFISNMSDEASQCSFLNDNTTWCIMRPENVMYDARHPSIQEQLAFLPIDITLKKFKTETQLKIPNANEEKTDSNKNYKVVQPLDDEMREKLFKQCKENVQQLVDKGILNVCKTARQNYVDQSPIKILQSFFNKKLVKSSNESHEDNQNQYVLPNLIKRLKVISNCYRKQPSKIIEINNLAKSNSQKSKNEIFRIKEDQKTEITDTTSVALTLHNEQLSTVPEKLNLNKIFNKKLFKVNTKNKFAFKILNGMIRHNSTMAKSFILQFPSDTKIIAHSPSIELELHCKLIPSVQNILCAKLNRGVGKNIINVYKQKIVMKYDETKSPESVTSSVLKENILLSGYSIEIPQFKKEKRKMPLPPLHNTKTRKIVDLSVNNINKSRTQATIINQTNDNAVFKNPPTPSVINKNNCQQINTSNTSQEQEPKISSIAPINTNANEFSQKPSTSSQIIPSTVFLKIDADDFRLEPSTSSHVQPDIDQLKINLNELSEEPSNQLIINITSPKANANEIRQKPLMKCLPFHKVDNIIITELEKNAKLLASSLSMDSTNVSPSSNSALIDPIVQNFKNSISQKKCMIRANLVDDPIVRDYIERTQLKTHETKRKFKLPESMMALPVEVLDLIPDNQREIKYVIDFYHAMATVIVKVLDVYVKKSCKQGRIKNDDDFKYLAKKLNSNILFKELQVKKVEELRISDSVKQKVELYIKKYMLKYGKLYRRKNTDQ